MTRETSSKKEPHQNRIWGIYGTHKGRRPSSPHQYHCRRGCTHPQSRHRFHSRTLATHHPLLLPRRIPRWGLWRTGHPSSSSNKPDNYVEGGFSTNASHYQLTTSSVFHVCGPKPLSISWVQACSAKYRQSHICWGTYYSRVFPLNYLKKYTATVLLLSTGSTHVIYVDITTPSLSNSSNFVLFPLFFWLKFNFGMSLVEESSFWKM